jgi:hypothetical protein
MDIFNNQKFELGRMVMTAAASTLDPIAMTTMLRAHSTGNWGDLNEADKRANESALKNGERILSRYNKDGQGYYVITEWDRSYTTIMRVEDY